ncbi:MAG TPA: sensor domain-containing diguanylate cyclase [Desulfovibrio sp.]|jgi:diguanylate cyclase (GGDEF)-like protein|uniref:GGDEF domain-containing protein n=1 Tax=Desulfovibrio TaxID=872 RepID=UPI0003FF1AF5|nr:MULTISPECIES: sensor domain-containing diguanylate cyclase [Desulfovibrio]MDY0307776.1 sensor domain-containing diguanylate cyclase [Desulfovibrionaceae bacterium]HMM37296.1 sensor domain-containing diguanylate cyclase [Desulfovibrio sp.]
MDDDRASRLIFQTQHIQGLLRLCGWGLLLTPTLVAVAALVAVGEGLSWVWALLLILSGLALALLAALFLARLLARRIIDPLGRLLRAAQDIHEGRYGTTVDMETFRDSPLEFRLLGQSFNRMSETTQEHIEALEQATITDQLTGIHNRRFLVTEGPRLLQVALRSGASFSCLMIDIDHFKRVNDQHGHLVGDRFLVHLTRVVAANIRTSDLLARAGGEEFVVLAPGSNTEEARLLADRIRLAVVRTPCEEGGARLDNTVSIGVAEHSRTPLFGSNVFEDMLERADQALYRAKGQGRNRVVAWGDEEPTQDL